MKVKIKVLLNKILKQFSIAFLFQLILYVVQYLLTPKIYFFGPHGGDPMSVFLFISTAVIAFIGMYRFVPNLIYWLLTIPFYYIFVDLYHPEDIYGIDYCDPLFGYMTSPNVLTITISILATQVFVWIIVALIRLILKFRA